MPVGEPCPWSQKEPRGLGGKREGKVGREGLWLEGRLLQVKRGALQGQLGPNPHRGLLLVGLQASILDEALRKPTMAVMRPENPYTLN